MAARIAFDTRLLVALLACLAGCGGAGTQASRANQLPPSTLLATIPVGTPPTLLTISPDGSRVFAASSGQLAITYVTNQVKEYIAVVDLAAGTTMESSLDMRPSDVTLGRDGRTLYVTGCREFCTTGTVEVIDTSTFSVIRRFDVGPGPYRFALSPDGTGAYTTNLGGPSLTVIDVASGTRRAALPVGVEPSGLAVSPDGTRIYVVSKQERTLTIVDGTRNTTVRTCRSRAIRAKSSSARTVADSTCRRAGPCSCWTPRVCSSPASRDRSRQSASI